MKAITIIQPWATLLATGKKRCETRSWKTNYRGEILLHAGKKDIVNEMLGIMSISDVEIFENAGITGDPLPLGAIIGKATLTDCILITQNIHDRTEKEDYTEFTFGDYSVGRYAWVMENPILFENPIPVVGKQGLWNYGGIENEELGGVLRSNSQYSNSKGKQRRKEETP